MRWTSYRALSATIEAAAVEKLAAVLDYYCCCCFSGLLLLLLLQAVEVFYRFKGTIGLTLLSLSRQLRRGSSADARFALLYALTLVRLESKWRR